jgi:hypothetical protein
MLSTEKNQPRIHQFPERCYILNLYLISMYISIPEVMSYPQFISNQYLYVYFNEYFVLTDNILTKKKILTWWAPRGPNPFRCNDKVILVLDLYISNRYNMECLKLNLKILVFRSRIFLFVRYWCSNAIIYCRLCKYRRGKLKKSGITRRH